MRVWKGRTGPGGREGLEGTDWARGREGLEGTDWARGREGLEGTDWARGREGLEGTDWARGREGLEGCPKTSSSGIMPSLFFHVVELTRLKFRTL